MTLEQDIERILLQEKRLQFDHFDADTAWELGSRLRALGEARSAPIAIDIQIHTMPVFLSALPGSSADNFDWIRRKRNVVIRFLRSSYAVGLELQRDGRTLEAVWGLSTRDHAPHGGGFPIIVKGAGCIGTIGVSGLPQREDHALMVEALAAMLNVPLDEVKLGPE
jgi:uncharacterized protein (UPF0303 family)